ncbi:hypothetical protein [Melittangium boletus]|uniref:Lipoprotein n=1 Tax=Melittangium boletus DSM 14713 TaxID=1294270 RepID=A0A250IT07_9BACT|nr:hypothetical protein [Melittangium boletus]ATB34370.1 hypothetical protein MEBOL_007872 [Melittangium boletus DSM 14713]
MRMSNIGACVLALVVVACGGAVETETQTSETGGTLQLPLTTPGPENKTYRLVGASFNITGPETVAITDTSADTLNVPLEVGDYAIEIGGTYHLERADEPGKPVSAQLISPTTLTFAVTKATTTQVRFQFKLAGSGTADVGFSVDNGGFISGTFHVDHASAPPDGSPLFTSLVNKDIPFTLSYSTATITKEDYGAKTLSVLTGPIFVQFGGVDSAGLTRDVAPAFNGQQLAFQLRAEPDGRVTFSGIQLYGSPERRFDLHVQMGAPFTAPLDSEGYPLPGLFQFSTTNYPSSARLMGPPAYGDAMGWVVDGKGASN